MIREPIGDFPRHFDGKRFFNPDAPQAHGFLDVIRWKLTSRPETSPPFVDDVAPSVPPPEIEGGQLRVTLVNHSTVLLQRRGFHLLTDPVWSNRVSPFTWIGPRRRRNPGVELRHLPRIDVVLLSHNHYDHLDLATLRRLAARKQSTFLVPIGVGRLLKSQGISPVHELDWGDRLPLHDAVIHSVPAAHFSARGPFDRNRTLWCGYWIEHGGCSIYFAGDTAFGGHFEHIRRRLGTPRLALLPIGAYEPRWFMSSVHMNPEDALQAHAVLGAATSIAIHHGTFHLGDESIDTPARKLRECDPGETVLLLRNGQSVTLDS